MLISYLMLSLIIAWLGKGFFIHQKLKLQIKKLLYCAVSDVMFKF